jgi:hypothetical protein
MSLYMVVLPMLNMVLAALTVTWVALFFTS